MGTFFHGEDSCQQQGDAWFIAQGVKDAFLFFANAPFENSGETDRRPIASKAVVWD